MSAEEAGVTSVSTEMHIEYDDQGRRLMRSEAEVNGETVISEDVWFAEAVDALVEEIQSDEQLMAEEYLPDCIV